MGTETSRKISEASITLLDEWQAHLRRRGITVSQKDLIDESIHIAVKNEEAMIERLKKKTKDNTADNLKRFLQHAGKFDFGKNWLEEIDTTL